MPRPKLKDQYYDDGDFDSSPNSSQSQSPSVNEDDLEMQGYVADCLNYILSAAENSALIRRQNIVKYPLRGKTRICDTVLAKVKDKLKEVRNS